MFRNQERLTPDITLEYRDNANGVDDFPFMYGFDVEVYYADLAQNNAGVLCNRSEQYTDTEVQDATGSAPGPSMVHSDPSDSTRIKIYNVFNPSADTDNAMLELIQDPEKRKDAKKKREDSGITFSERLYEFMAVDGTFADMDLGAYPEFLAAFDSTTGCFPSFNAAKRNFE